MYLLIIFLPLLGSFLAGFFGRYFGFIGSSKLIIFCMLLTLVFSFIGLIEVVFLKSTVYIDLFYWIDCEYLNLSWGFMFDDLTSIMCIVVVFVSFLVHLYSIEYMYSDPNLSRFMSYLSLFTFFMLILISADNLIQMFIGWEGVGLCSYLLINFWSTRIQANKAAIKAMIVNRIGDFGLIIGVIIIFIYFKSMDYLTLNLLFPIFKNQTILFDFYLIDFIGFFIFIGAIGKSAQIGLHTWLPDAMEGPTPVSALIHAATMVTAGVFLVIRMSFLFDNSFKVSQIIIVMGVFTSLLASTTGLLQNDFKKIIAYSTCSQLGYMVFSSGLSDYFIGLFHLTNHAFFKALLFLSAGASIHAINDEQDIRKMGGLKTFLPLTYTTSVIGSLALAGFPFLTGFYSKDFILESAFSKFTLLGYFSYLIGTLGAFLTAFYSIRLIFLVFLSKPNGYKNILCYSIESDFNIKFVLIALSIPSIFIGYFSKDLIIGFGTTSLFSSIFVGLKIFNIFDSEFIQFNYKILPVISGLIGLILALFLYSFYSYLLFYIKLNPFSQKVYNFLNRKWFFDKIYNNFFSQAFFKFGYFISYKFIDRGIFESIGPSGLAFLSLNSGILLYKLQTIHFYHLFITILIGITYILIIFYFFTLFSYNLIFLNFIIILLS